jgi:hypothetical protein
MAMNDNDTPKPIPPRDVELDRTISVLERELGPMTIHQRIILAREIDAYADRVAPNDMDPTRW